MPEFKIGDRVRMLGDAAKKGVITDVCEPRGCYRVLWCADPYVPASHVAPLWIARVDE